MRLKTKLLLIFKLNAWQGTPLMIIIDLLRTSRICCSFSSNLELTQLAQHPKEH